MENCSGDHKSHISVLVAFNYLDTGQDHVSCRPLYHVFGISIKCYYTGRQKRYTYMGRMHLDRAAGGDLIQSRI